MMTDEVRELKKKAILYGYYSENDNSTFTDEGVILAPDGGVLMPGELTPPDAFNWDAIEDKMQVHAQLTDVAWRYLERNNSNESTD